MTEEDAMNGEKESHDPLLRPPKEKKKRPADAIPGLSCRWRMTSLWSPQSDAIGQCTDRKFLNAVTHLPAYRMLLLSFMEQEEQGCITVR